MSPINDKLPSMLALARARTEDSRLELAGLLADIFLAPEISLSLREEEMVNELIDQLMLDSTPRLRAQLVEKFVDIARMPRRVASTLAQDNSIAIARPILLASPALTDQDLIQVVTGRGGEHALAVASREKIGEAVADALVTTGDVRVMQLVAENLGAHLSRAAVDIVADAARYAAELRAPLMRRPEMNAEAALRLYWWVEQDLRRYALKRFGITSGQIDQALASTIAAFLDDHAHQKKDDEVMRQVAQWLADHNAITTAVLPQVLRMGHFRLFNMLVARLTGLTLSLVDTIMAEAGGRGLASICRAAEIDKPGFVSLFLLARGGRPGDQVVHPRELSHALATFDRMSPAIARDLLHSWSVNPDYFARHREEAAKEDHLFL